MRTFYSKNRLTRLQKLLLAAIAAAAVFLAANIPFLAEYFFARGLTRALGFLLGKISSVFPFSLYELTAFALILGGAALLVGIVLLLRRKNFGRLRLWLYRLGMAVLSVLLAFGVLYAPLYNRLPVQSALGLEETSLTEEKVYQAALYYVEQLNALSAQTERDKEGNILPALSFRETAESLNAAFSAQDPSYFAFYEVTPKPVAFSVFLSYLGITGIYFPFYAEANVSTDVPAYTLPFTMAHEMAHAKGVSQEGEANVAAYVLCVCSENDYIRYSGLMSAAASLINSLPQERAEELSSLLAEEVKREYRNASEHYRKYEGLLDTISSFFNDLFLKANGVQGGTRSYSDTVRSLVSLWEKLQTQ